MNSLTIKTWREMRDQIKTLNQPVAEIIDQLPKVDQFKLLHLRYHFGQDIIDRDHFGMPFQGGLYHCQDKRLPKQIRDLLAYQWRVLPFGLTLRNTLEAFVELPTHTIPFKLYQPGQFFSLLSTLGGTQPVLSESLSTVAGCRSLITLPQIAHTQYQERITKRLRLKQNFAPKHFLEQWEFFKAVSDARQAQHHWHTELVCFGREFIEAIEAHPLVKSQLLMSVWQNTSSIRHQAVYDLVWSAFLEENLSLSTRNSVAVVETARYILSVLLGVSPAYVPAVSDSGGPVDSLTRVILDIYRIRYYLPVFMQLQYYDGQQPLYYSLQKPTFMHAMGARRQSSKQAIHDLKRIKKILGSFKEQVLGDQLPISIKNSLLFQRLEHNTFEYYHPKAGELFNSDIQSLLQQDPRFLQIQAKYRHYHKLALPDTSPFFHGCIKISPC